MSESKPRAPAKLPFSSLTPEQFEELCYLLARLDNPGLERLRSPDGGLDALLRSSGKVLRGWQAKRFVRSVQWPQCLASVRAARENFAVPWITFCFPFDLSVSQLRQFERQLVDGFPDVQFDWWGSSELTARIVGSAEGQHIANHYFREPGTELEQVVRAARAGRELNTTRQAIQHLTDVGGLLRSDDPYFKYQAGFREPGVDSPAPLPGTVMRMELEDDTGVAHLDALPRFDDAVAQAGPAGRMLIPGEHADRLEQFFKTGGQVEIEGAKIEWDKLPSRFADLVPGPAEDATIVLSGEPQPPLLVTVALETDAGSASMDFDLRRTEPPAGWEGALDGTTHGLSLRLAVRRKAAGQGEMNLHWQVTENSTGVAREELAVMELLVASVGRGTLRVLERSTGNVFMEADVPGQPPEPHVEDRRKVMAAVVAIEDWTGVTIPVPDEIQVIEAKALLEVAHLLEGIEGSWTTASFELTKPTQFDWPPEGQLLQWRETLSLQVFGHTIELGERAMYLSAAQIARTQATPSGGQRVEVVPVAGEGRQVQRLERPKGVARDESRDK